MAIFTQFGIQIEITKIIKSKQKKFQGEMIDFIIVQVENKNLDFKKNYNLHSLKADGGSKEIDRVFQELRAKLAKGL